MNLDKNKLNMLGWTCPLPLQSYPTIVMGHGAGGKMMADLIEHLARVGSGQRQKQDDRHDHRQDTDPVGTRPGR